MSDRDKEKVCLAELKAQRSLLKLRQALLAEENLDLELEMVKAEEREKAFEEAES